MLLPALGAAFGVSVDLDWPFANRLGTVEPNALVEPPNDGLAVSGRS